MQIFNPRKENIKIMKVIRVRDKGILIEAEQEEDIQKIKNNTRFHECGLKVTKPGKRQPKVIIFNINNKISETEIIEAVYEQNKEKFTNISKDDFKKEFKPIFRVGKRKEHVTNWIIETSPKVRNEIRKHNKLFIQWNSCRTEDFIGLSRCYKCQNIGHVSKHCPNEKSICGHCGQEGRKFTECPKKNAKPQCILCKRAKKPSEHSARDKNFPAFKYAQELAIKRTDYDAS